MLIVRSCCEHRWSDDKGLSMYRDSSLDLVATDIRRQDKLIADSLAWFREVTLRAAEKLGPRPSRIYLVGCGDSFDAHTAVRFLWEKLVGVPVEAVQALTFTRYLISAAPRDALVIALSQSGMVSRLIEAARLANANGQRVVVITGNPKSVLAQEPAAAQIITPFPKVGPVPGTSSYTFNMTLLYELGAALGQMWGDSAAAVAEVRDQLTRLPALIRESLDPVWEVAAAHADGTSDRTAVHLFLGTGPNLATARFAARKFFEIPQLAAMAQETEEYAHDQISMVGSNTPSLVFAPSGAASSRNSELLASLIELRSPVAVVTERGADLGLERQPRWRYEVEPGLDELLSPLLHALAPQVYTYELAGLVGGSFYGYGDPVLRAIGDRLIYESEVIL